MTIKDVIQHPSTANIKLVATGVVIGLLAQHWIDTKGGISAAQQFLSSDAFKATFLLVLGVLSAVQKGMASANPAPIVTLGASNIWPSSVTASLPTVQVTPSQNQPAAMNPSPVLDVDRIIKDKRCGSATS